MDHAEEETQSMIPEVKNGKAKKKKRMKVIQKSQERDEKVLMTAKEKRMKKVLVRGEKLEHP